MPELPEVETVKETLKKIIVGKKIKNVEVYFNGLIKDITPFVFCNTIIHKKIVDIKRRGKFLIFDLDGLYMLTHLRMEGKFFIKHSSNKREKHEHLIFTLDDDTTLIYHDTRKFGTFHLREKHNAFDVLPLSKQGYEPFDKRLTVEYLSLRISKSRKKIKTILLDQTIIAGLGNIYVDEVLFRSNIHPLRLGNTMSLKDFQSIIYNSIIVLTKAISLGGTTIRSYTSSLGVTGRFQNELLVHTKEGECCPNCSNRIIKITVGGRGTYLCDFCQI